MFITNSISSPSTLSLATIAVSGSSGNFAPIVNDQLLPPSYALLDLSGIVISNGVGTVSYLDLPPKGMVINNQVYNYTLNNQPNSNQFTVNNGQLVINLGATIPPPQVSYVVTNVAIPTTIVPIPHPDLCTMFPLTGELT